MEIRTNTDKHRFEAVVDGEVAGFVKYLVMPDGAYDLIHTELDPAFQGQGVGGRLAAGAVEGVQAAGAHLIPSCPFIRKWMIKHPDTHGALVPWVALVTD